MSNEFLMPALGADMEYGTLVEWRVAPGQAVKRGDIVAVVETDKGAIDVEIFQDGVIQELVAQPGAKLPVGALLARLVGEAGVPGAPAAPTPAAQRPRSSPAARARAQQLGIDLATLSGTGPSGTVTLQDVERAAGAPASTTPAAAAPAPAVEGARGGMREAIAAAMSRSKREIPHYYLSLTLDVSDATAWLAAHNATVPVTERLLFAVLLIKALAIACRQLEGFSGFYRGGRYERIEPAQVGVAVALRGGGLVAPALMDAGNKPLGPLMGEMRELVARARAGHLRASELAASSIVLTNLGDSAVDVVLPIIQPPQVAIVGAGATVERPWVVAGRVEPRQLLTLSLGADHRVTDGRLGAQFLTRIGDLLREPGKL